jgi:hypothetical protein
VLGRQLCVTSQYVDDAAARGSGSPRVYAVSVFADGSKARRAGFHEYVDTEAMFLAIFEDLRRQRIIP